MDWGCSESLPPPPNVTVLYRNGTDGFIEVEVHAEEHDGIWVSPMPASGYVSIGEVEAAIEMLQRAVKTIDNL